MANTFLNIDEITLAALDVFENSLGAAKTCSRAVESSFAKKGAQIGDSIRIRKPVQFTVRSGTTFAAQDITETNATLTLDKQRGVDFAMTSKERTLNLGDFINTLVKPAIVRLANEIDSDVISTVSKATFTHIGTPGTTPSSTQTYIDAGTRLSDMTCPRGPGERHLMVNPEMEGDIAYALREYTNPGNNIGMANRTAEIGFRAAGWDWMMDQNAYRHTVGTYGGTPLINGASETGSTIASDGWTSGGTALKDGDRFTIADVYAVNPVTKSTLSYLQQFVITADTSDSSGDINALPISPSITTSGAFQNVSAGPADNAAITMVGTTGQVYSMGLGMNEQAAALAIVPLEKPGDANRASVKYDSQSGVGIRCVEWYDGDDDKFKVRFDVLYGLVTQRPEWAVVIAAA